MPIAVLPIEDIWGLRDVCESNGIEIINFGSESAEFSFDFAKKNLVINNFQVDLRRRSRCIYMPLNYEDNYTDIIVTQSCSDSSIVKLQTRSANRFIEYSLENHFVCANPPLAGKKFSNKAIFMTVLESSGFVVPNTVITNNYGSVIEMMCTDYAVKVLSSHNHGENNTAHFVSRFSSHEIIMNRSLIDKCILIYQQKISFKEEFRTYYVVGCACTIKICRTDDGPELDYRLIDLPESAYSFDVDAEGSVIMSLCKRIEAKTSLKYFVVDWIFCEGRIFGFDLNPHGSWYWLPEQQRYLVQNFVNTRLLSFAVGG